MQTQLELPGLIKQLSRSPIDNLRWSSHLQKTKAIYQGEWTNEPDQITWFHPDDSIVCCMHRNYMFGYWCGYLGLPYVFNDVEDIPFHGGVTYKDSSLRCYKSESNEPVIKVWLGFDCAHIYDVHPFQLKMTTAGCSYRNVEYVAKCLFAAKDYVNEFNEKSNE